MQIRYNFEEKKTCRGKNQNDTSIFQVALKNINYYLSCQSLSEKLFIKINSFIFLP